MTRNHIVSLSLLTMLATTTAHADLSEFVDAQREITAVIAAQFDAENRLDLDAIMAGYSPGIVHHASGTFTYGNAAVRASLKEPVEQLRMARDKEGIRRTAKYEIDQFSVLGRDTFLVTVNQSTTLSKEGVASHTSRSATSLVFMKIGDHWKIVHEASSDVPAANKVSNVAPNPSSAGSFGDKLRAASDTELQKARRILLAQVKDYDERIERQEKLFRDFPDRDAAELALLAFQKLERARIETLYEMVLAETRRRSAE